MSTGAPAALASTVTASALASAHAEVAYHWFAAKDSGRALVASIDAGLAAERAFALSEARSQFDRALRLWWEAPNARALAQVDLVDLYRRACAHADGAVDPVLEEVVEARRAQAKGDVGGIREHAKAGERPERAQPRPQRR